MVGPIGWLVGHIGLVDNFLIPFLFLADHDDHNIGGWWPWWVILVSWFCWLVGPIICLFLFLFLFLFLIMMITTLVVGGRGG